MNSGAHGLIFTFIELSKIKQKLGRLIFPCASIAGYSSILRAIEFTHIRSFRKSRTVRVYSYISKESGKINVLK